MSWEKPCPWMISCLFSKDQIAAKMELWSKASSSITSKRKYTDIDSNDELAKTRHLIGKYNNFSPISKNFKISLPALISCLNCFDCEMCLIVFPISWETLAFYSYSLTSYSFSSILKSYHWFPVTPECADTPQRFTDTNRSLFLAARN